MLDVGPTQELSLRVSVATLARIILPNTEDGQPVLALEHKATVRKAKKGMPGESQTPPIVNAQPFGGAVRLLDYNRLLRLIEDFHFDSEHSHQEGDFRLYIQPSDWEIVRWFCLENFATGHDSVLEASPERELIEEFHDTLGIELHAKQYTVKPVGTVLEDQPQPSDNIYATGAPTVRIYRVFEVQIPDPVLFRAMVANYLAHPGHILSQQAL